MTGAHFQAPVVVENKDGWGPTDDTFQYKDMPYQPYSKSDQLGKVNLIFLMKKQKKNMLSIDHRLPIGREHSIMIKEITVNRTIEIEIFEGEVKLF